MCWTTSEKEYKTRRIAKEDIPCYKVVDSAYYKGEYISEYQEFLYKEGKTYKTNIYKRKIGNSIEINEGFHSYNTIETAYKREPWISCCGNTIIKCIIPKGSNYYINPAGGMVSNQIKIIECVG